uniref:EF-hand domain-containing protein n=1 Tax=Prasinoderma singulare TaxID=676789 RepID=A0A7S3B819_9VIRI
MSTEEQAELRAAFQALDANGDGELSVDELREGLGTADKAGALGVHGEKLLKALQAMDIDGNGVVDYNEWLASTMAVRKLTNEAAIRSAFEKFDANGDGRISRDEIAKALANAGEQTDDAELAQILREADTDNSGDIDFNEFLTHMRREREAHGNDPIGLPRQLPKSAYQAGAE